MISAIVDFRPNLLEIRHQGRRNSCLSFATSCAHEYKIGSSEQLSVEYLFYHSVASTLGQNPAAGTTMQATIQALAREGQPLEKVWPYTKNQLLPWAPPNVKITPFKAIMKCGSTLYVDIVNQLEKGFLVILGLIITDAFFAPDINGLIINRTPDIERGGHAVLAVGHGLDLHHQPVVLIRNSWGEGWGLNGYAWVSLSYLVQHLHETASLI